MISSVIPARLEFRCGHAALVSLPRLKGESAAQRTERINGEKSGARGRACDFCGPREQALVDVRSVQETAASGARNGHPGVEQRTIMTHRTEAPAVTTHQTAQPNGRPGISLRSKASVRSLHQPSQPQVQLTTPVAGLPQATPEAAQAPATLPQLKVSAASTPPPASVRQVVSGPSARVPTSVPQVVSAASTAPVEPAAVPRPAGGRVPAASTTVTQRPRRRVGVAEPTPIRSRRVPTPLRGPAVSARAAARSAPGVIRSTAPVAANRLQRFQIRFSAETVVRAPDIHAALRQLESLGATDIVSIALTSV